MQRPHWNKSHMCHFPEVLYNYPHLLFNSLYLFPLSPPSHTSIPSIQETPTASLPWATSVDLWLLTASWIEKTLSTREDSPSPSRWVLKWQRVLYLGHCQVGFLSKGGPPNYFDCTGSTIKVQYKLSILSWSYLFFFLIDSILSFQQIQNLSFKPNFTN